MSTDEQKPQTPPANSGANDNPDEFSEFRRKDAPATEDYSPESRRANPAEQRGHVEQNQNPEAVAAARNGSESERRAAYALDDPRYGSAANEPSWSDKDKTDDKDSE
ncbi:hypothetical protein F0P96_12220 [Hymenobacter busanensis]|uniref:Uncharacterized protein n=1 Tax=Hymenobacter busanensis TaxID=2607656 RepID=A0A7L4ZW22_9BACT|nr:hypothetical protein [Hymenobacter busanensis]KAA9332241.1 hypothetical protein F0P96_12220 [Hymenobacter busanensis]QHJ07421.1 hypothetical protein GUY19_09050 [Hymenobacter busanensis]